MNKTLDRNLRREMHRLMVITSEHGLFEEIARLFQNNKPLELKVFDETLDFLEQFLTRYPQLVILDLDLLGERVFKVMNILRSLKQDLKIILLLSRDQMKTCSKALTLGVVTYLLKPVNASNAYHIIKSTLKP